MPQVVPWGESIALAIGRGEYSKRRANYFPMAHGYLQYICFAIIMHGYERNFIVEVQDRTAGKRKGCKKPRIGFFEEKILRDLYEYLN